MFQTCKKRICVNLNMLYGIFKLFDKYTDNVFLYKKKRLQLKDWQWESKEDIPFTYCAALAKIDFDARTILKYTVPLTLLMEIFWQIAMALYACRTHLGIFHNDTHTGNIFLTTIDEPCTIIYKNGKKQRRIIVHKCYATLGDFGLANSHPIVCSNPGVLNHVIVKNKIGYHDKHNYVSDFNRLISTLFEHVDKLYGTTLKTPDEMLFTNLKLIWVNIRRNIIATLIRASYMTSKFEYVKPFDDEIFTILQQNTKLPDLYNEELQMFEKYAFNEDVIDEPYPESTIVCDITPPDYVKRIPPISNCSMDDGDTTGCSLEAVPYRNTVGDVVGMCKKINTYKKSMSSNNITRIIKTNSSRRKT